MRKVRAGFRAALGTVAVLVVLGGAMLPAHGQEAMPVTPADVVDEYTPGEVMTEHGPVSVPGSPERVVTLSEYALDTAVATGVVPVGAIATAGQDGVASYIASEVPDVTIVGRAGDIDVEAIRELEPDLILASWQTDDELYAELTRISPTIVPPSIEEGTPNELRGWEYDVLVYAHALGKADEAATDLQGMHDRVTALREGVAQPLAGHSAAVVSWTADGPDVLTSDEFSSVQLYRAGFVPVAESQTGQMSPEELALIDVDWLFIAYADDGRVPDFDGVVVVMVDFSLWASAAGPIAANLVLDDIEKAVVE